MNKTINQYNLKATDFFSQYESKATEEIHKNWILTLNIKNGLVLDIGAGSGRDAFWLARNGFEVIAVEPAKNLRNLAIEKNDHELITWVNDTLPDLNIIQQLNKKFDLIILSAVWMHIPINSRKIAFKVISQFLKHNGKLVITLRHGKSPDERIMYDVSFQEISKLAKVNALSKVEHFFDDDKLKRNNICWETVIFELS